MRCVVQRVKRCSVSVNGKIHSEIGEGLLVLLGIEGDDEAEDVRYLTSKICSMRIFPDSDGKMNVDIKENGSDLLVVSQFTLHASTKKGNRPSFIKAARPEKAIPLYERFISECSGLLGKPCSAGIFGAHMDVELVNDGPVTIILDSKNKE